MFARVVLASKATTGAPPLISVHMRYPRIIHGELMTHRVFSRNARSSRAVPVRTMLNEVTTGPFVPWHWGKNQKGMQALEECNEKVRLGWEEVSTGIGELPEQRTMTREETWLWARDQAVAAAEAFMEAGYHKQLANRLLEPFSFIDTLVTSTSWANFFHLRRHKDAEPHFRDLADLVFEAIENAEFQTLGVGEWHLPYVNDADWKQAGDFVHKNGNGVVTHEAVLEVLKKISAARCARISYAPFDGNPSYERELERFEHLINSERMHASPVEHQATPDTLSHYELTSVDLNTGHESLVSSGTGYDNQHLHGNLDGWVQWRKTFPDEALRDAA